MVTAKSAQPSVRDRILSTASELFYQEGVRGVGIDRIIAESGVAKMSLYKHFKSKDVLIATYLEERTENWLAWLHTRVEELATEPCDRILAVFDVYKEWFEQPDFHGCAFINTSIELFDSGHPAYQVCLNHMQAVADFLSNLVKEAKLPEPDILASQLMILLKGAVVETVMQGNSDPAVRAKQAAVILIKH